VPVRTNSIYIHTP